MHVRLVNDQRNETEEDCPSTMLGTPFERIALNISNFIYQSVKNDKYIIVIMKHFTKWQ